MESFPFSPDREKIERTFRLKIPKTFKLKINKLLQNFLYIFAKMGRDSCHWCKLTTLDHSGLTLVSSRSSVLLGVGSRGLGAGHGYTLLGKIKVSIRTYMFSYSASISNPL